MASSSPSTAPSRGELIHFITYTGESDNIDAKGPTRWDGGEESAKLAKDIAAFANSRDGGVLVLGKEEPTPGKFVLKGLTQDQADSFDTTKVAVWVNRHFDPPIRLVCHRQEHEGRLFVVITVAEFSDIPALCTKSFQDPSNPKKHLLREKSIYVRTANAESAPLGSVDEFRTLIGLATRKRRTEFLGMLSTMLKGRPLLQAPTDEEHFQGDLSQVRDSLKLNDDSGIGKWDLWFHPGKYVADRCTELKELESFVRRHSVRIVHEFPGHYRGTHPREWGIANDLYGETWALTRSGLFVYQHPFRENETEFRSPWRSINGESEEPIRPGEWMEFQWNIRVLIEFFMFMSRIVEEYDPGETLVYQLRAAPLEGRKLVTLNTRLRLGHGPPQPCRAMQFQRRVAVPVEELRAEWEDKCAEEMRQFYELFPEHNIEFESLREWVERFKRRDF